MSESKEERIERLLEEGLEHYGMDNVSEAFVAWKQVIALDPENAQALDYMQNAERRTRPRDGSAPASPEGLLREANALMGRGDLENALELLRNGGSKRVDLPLEATVELLRSRLLLQYRRELDVSDQSPGVTADAAAIKRYNLSPDAGFLLSLVDGSTSVDQLISLSGMDAFEALRTLKGLVDAGIVSMAA